MKFSLFVRGLVLFSVVCFSFAGAKEESKDKQDVGTVIGIDLGMLMC